MNPSANREFGPWKINIPSHKKALLNGFTLWFLLVRIYDKIKTLLKIIPFKYVSYTKKLKSKKKMTKLSTSLNTTVNKIHLKDNPASQKDEKSIWIFSQPRKPSNKGLDPQANTFNWMYFSENFYLPSIFIQSHEFLESTLKPILLNSTLCTNLVEFAKKYLTEKPKDKFQRKLVKYFLRLMLVFSRNKSRDVQILGYLSDLVHFNKTSIKRGKELTLRKFLLLGYFYLAGYNRPYQRNYRVSPNTSRRVLFG